MKIQKYPLTLIMIGISLLINNAQAQEKIKTNLYKFTLDNFDSKSEDFTEILISGNNHYIYKEDADLHKLKYQSTDTKFLNGRLVVNLNNLGTVINNGADIILKPFTTSLLTANYDLQNNQVTAKKEFSNSTFLNYSVNTDTYNKQKSINTSIFKTFDNGVLYNLNTNYSNNSTSKFSVLDLYREQYFTDKLTSLKIGTAYSGSNAMTNPVSFIGIQYRKNYELDSNYIKNPYLSISGTADAKSIAEIFVNDKNYGNIPINQGPYDFKNLYSGQAAANEVKIIVKDLNGNVQSVTSQSLIGAPYNLKSGTDNYSFEAGKFRNGYNDFGAIFSSATYAYGYTDRLTIEGHYELAPGQVRLASNLTYATAYGTIQGGLAVGQNQHLVKTQYNYSSGNLSLNAAVVQAKNFTTFGNINNTIANQKILSGSYRFGKLNFSASTVKYGENLSRQSLSLNTNYKSANISFNINRSGKDKSIGFYLSMPIGNDSKWRSMTNIYNDTNGTSYSQNISKYGNVNDYNISIDATKDGQGNKGFNSTVQYDTQNGLATVTANNSSNYKNISGRFDGSIILDKGVNFSKTIYQGYALVDATYKDIPISLNNVEYAKTNKNGIAVIPNLYSGIDNKISIDTNKLQNEISVDNAEFNVSTYQFYKKDIVFNIRKNPVYLKFSNAINDKSIEIEGNTYFNTKKGIYFDNYKPNKEYDLNIKSCRAKFKLSTEEEMNSTIKIKCEE